MNHYKYSGGAVVAALIGMAVVAVLVIRWLGQNSAAISAGVRAAGQVFIVLVAAGGITAVALQVQRARRRAAAPPVPDPAPPPITAIAEQLPEVNQFTRLMDSASPLELTSGDTHIHFHGMTAEQAAEAIRQATEGR